jgi:hypothetical protein
MMATIAAKIDGMVLMNPVSSIIGLNTTESLKEFQLSH